ncbi:MAG: hypothetical protein GY937_00635 [bacterium]|nr:hypothetical protein [bacterium]
MAYLVVRKGGRVEVREAHNTAKGPRSRMLTSFKGALTPRDLDRAEAAATRPIDRERLLARARERGVPIERSSAGAAARHLLSRLRKADGLDPAIVTLLREQLEEHAAAAVPDELADAVEWLGASDHERGHALRDVLRLYDTIARSRDPVREPEQERFPRFEVQPERRAS